MFIALNHQTVEYTRSIYNLIDVLGDIGGLQVCLHLVLGFLASVLLKGGVMNSLFSKLFFFMPDQPPEQTNMVADHAGRQMNHQGGPRAGQVAAVVATSSKLRRQKTYDPC